MTETSLLKKWAAAGTALSFVLSVALTPAAEANFWADRRKAVSRTLSGDSSLDGAVPQTFASLIPSVDAAPKSPVVYQEWSLAADPARAAMAARLPEAVKAIPSSAADIREARLLPPSKEKGPLVVLVQDAHEVESAQRNIARLLEHLFGAAHRPVLVALEGCAGALEVGLYRGLKHQDAWAEAREFLFKKCLLTGAEYFGMKAPQEPPLWGVETPALYRANVAAYRASLPLLARARDALAGIQSSLDPLKARAFTPALKELDRLWRAHAEGGASSSEYLKFLAAQPRHGGRFPQVDLFARALAMEAKIDFKKTEAERAVLIRRLADRLSRASLDDMARMGLAYRAGQMGHAAFYSYLQGRLKDAGVSLSSYPAFQAYVDYVMVSDRVNAGQLFDEMEDLRAAVVDALASTPEQKTLFRLQADLMLARKLSLHALNAREWTVYAARRAEISRLPAAVRRLQGQTGGEDLSSLLSVFEDFYAAATRRNAAMASNLLSRLASVKGDGPVVMIAGGFHTQGLLDELEKRGLSTVVVTPKIQELPGSATDYLHVFSPDRTPVEKMLLGEKLMIPGEPATAKPILPESERTPTRGVEQALASAVYPAEAVSRGEAATPEALHALVVEANQIAANDNAVEDLVLPSASNGGVTVVRRSGPDLVVAVDNSGTVRPSVPGTASLSGPGEIHSFSVTQGRASSFSQRLGAARRALGRAAVPGALLASTSLVVAGAVAWFRPEGSSLLQGAVVLGVLTLATLGAALILRSAGRSVQAAVSRPAPARVTMGALDRFNHAVLDSPLGRASLVLGALGPASPAVSASVAVAEVVAAAPAAPVAMGLGLLAAACNAPSKEKTEFLSTSSSDAALPRDPRALGFLPDLGVSPGVTPLDADSKDPNASRFHINMLSLQDGQYSAKRLYFPAGTLQNSGTIVLKLRQKASEKSPQLTIKVSDDAESADNPDFTPGSTQSSVHLPASGGVLRVTINTSKLKGLNRSKAGAKPNVAIVSSEPVEFDLSASVEPSQGTGATLVSLASAPDGADISAAPVVTDGKPVSGNDDKGVSAPKPDAGSTSWRVQTTDDDGGYGGEQWTFSDDIPDGFIFGLSRDAGTGPLTVALMDAGGNLSTYTGDDGKTHTTQFTVTPDNGKKGKWQLPSGLPKGLRKMSVVAAGEQSFTTDLTTAEGADGSNLPVLDQAADNAKISASPEVADGRPVSGNDDQGVAAPKPDKEGSTSWPVQTTQDDGGFGGEEWTFSDDIAGGFTFGITRRDGEGPLTVALMDAAGNPVAYPGEDGKQHVTQFTVTPANGKSQKWKLPANLPGGLRKMSVTGPGVQDFTVDLTTSEAAIFPSLEAAPGGANISESPVVTDGKPVSGNEDQGVSAPKPEAGSTSWSVQTTEDDGGFGGEQWAFSGDIPSGFVFGLTRDDGDGPLKVVLMDASGSVVTYTGGDGKKHVTQFTLTPENGKAQKWKLPSGLPKGLRKMSVTGAGMQSFTADLSTAEGTDGNNLPSLAQASDDANISSSPLVTDGSAVSGNEDQGVAAPKPGAGSTSWSVQTTEDDGDFGGERWTFSDDIPGGFTFGLTRDDGDGALSVSLTDAAGNLGTYTGDDGKLHVTQFTVTPDNGKAQKWKLPANLPKGLRKMSVTGTGAQRFTVDLTTAEGASGGNLPALAASSSDISASPAATAGKAVSGNKDQGVGVQSPAAGGTSWTVQTTDDDGGFGGAEWTFASGVPSGYVFGLNRDDGTGDMTVSLLDGSGNPGTYTGDDGKLHVTQFTLTPTNGKAQKWKLPAGLPKDLTKMRVTGAGQQHFTADLTTSLDNGGSAVLPVLTEAPSDAALSASPVATDGKPTSGNKDQGVVASKPASGSTSWPVQTTVDDGGFGGEVWSFSQDIASGFTFGLTRQSGTGVLTVSLLDAAGNPGVYTGDDGNLHVTQFTLTPTNGSQQKWRLPAGLPAGMRKMSVTGTGEQKFTVDLTTALGTDGSNLPSLASAPSDAPLSATPSATGGKPTSGNADQGVVATKPAAGSTSWPVQTTEDDGGFGGEVWTFSQDIAGGFTFGLTRQSGSGPLTVSLLDASGVLGTYVGGDGKLHVTQFTLTPTNGSQQKWQLPANLPAGLRRMSVTGAGQQSFTADLTTALGTDGSNLPSLTSAPSDAALSASPVTTDGKATSGNADQGVVAPKPAAGSTSWPVQTTEDDGGFGGEIWTFSQDVAGGFTFGLTRQSGAGALTVTLLDASGNPGTYVGDDSKLHVTQFTVTPTNGSQQKWRLPSGVPAGMRKMSITGAGAQNFTADLTTDLDTGGPSGLPALAEPSSGTAISAAPSATSGKPTSGNADQGVVAPKPAAGSTSWSVQTTEDDGGFGGEVWTFSGDVTGGFVFGLTRTSGSGALSVSLLDASGNLLTYVGDDGKVHATQFTLTPTNGSSQKWRLPANLPAGLRKMSVTGVGQQNFTVDLTTVAGTDGANLPSLSVAPGGSAVSASSAATGGKPVSSNQDQGVLAPKPAANGLSAWPVQTTVDAGSFGGEEWTFSGDISSGFIFGLARQSGTGALTVTLMDSSGNPGTYTGTDGKLHVTQFSATPVNGPQQLWQLPSGLPAGLRRMSITAAGQQNFTATFTTNLASDQVATLPSLATTSAGLGTVIQVIDGRAVSANSDQGVRAPSPFPGKTNWDVQATMDAGAYGGVELTYSGGVYDGFVLGLSRRAGSGPLIITLMDAAGNPGIYIGTDGNVHVTQFAVTPPSDGSLQNYQFPPGTSNGPRLPGGLWRVRVTGSTASEDQFFTVDTTTNLPVSGNPNPGTTTPFFTPAQVSDQSSILQSFLSAGLPAVSVGKFSVNPSQAGSYLTQGRPFSSRGVPTIQWVADSDATSGVSSKPTDTVASFYFVTTGQTDSTRGTDLTAPGTPAPLYYFRVVQAGGANSGSVTFNTGELAWLVGDNGQGNNVNLASTDLAGTYPIGTDTWTQVSIDPNNLSSVFKTNFRTSGLALTQQGALRFAPSSPLVIEVISNEDPNFPQPTQPPAAPMLLFWNILLGSLPALLAGTAHVLTGHTLNMNHVYGLLASVPVVLAVHEAAHAVVMKLTTGKWPTVSFRDHKGRVGVVLRNRDGSSVTLAQALAGPLSGLFILAALPLLPLNAAFAVGLAAGAVLFNLMAGFVGDGDVILPRVERWTAGVFERLSPESLSARRVLANVSIMTAMAVVGVPQAKGAVTDTDMAQVEMSSLTLSSPETLQRLSARTDAITAALSRRMQAKQASLGDVEGIALTLGSLRGKAPETSRTVQSAVEQALGRLHQVQFGTPWSDVGRREFNAVVERAASMKPAPLDVSGKAIFIDLRGTEGVPAAVAARAQSAAASGQPVLVLTDRPEKAVRAEFIKAGLSSGEMKRFSVQSRGSAEDVRAAALIEGILGRQALRLGWVLDAPANDPHLDTTGMSWVDRILRALGGVEFDVDEKDQKELQGLTAVWTAA